MTTRSHARPVMFSRTDRVPVCVVLRVIRPLARTLPLHVVQIFGSHSFSRHRSIEVAMLARAQVLSEGHEGRTCVEISWHGYPICRRRIFNKWWDVGKVPTAPEILPASTSSRMLETLDICASFQLYQVANLRQSCRGVHRGCLTIMMNLCSFTLSVMLRKFFRVPDDGGRRGNHGQYLLRQ